MIIQVFHDYLSKTDKLQIWVIKHGRKGHIKKYHRSDLLYPVPEPPSDLARENTSNLNIAFGL